MYHTTGLDKAEVLDLCEMIHQESVPEEQTWPPILGLYRSVVVTLTYCKYSEFPSVDGWLDARRCWSTAVGAAGQATRADSLGGSVPAVSGWRAQAARSSGLVAQGRNRSRAAPVGGVPPAWAQACR